ncbi:hypothetical protein D3C84_136120 [compost metagenome]
MGLGLFPVDGGIDLGHVDLIAGEQARQFRHALALGDDVLGFLVQRLIAQAATVFDLQAEAADGAQPLYWWRREDRDIGVFDVGELGIECSGDGGGRLARVLALVEWLERGEDNAAVGAVGKAVDRQPRERHGVGHARLLEGNFRHLLDHSFRAVEAGGIRQLGKGHQVLLVLGRYETSRGSGEAQPRQSHEAGIQHQGDTAAANDPRHRADITMAGTVEEAVERAEQPAAEQLVEEPGEAVLRCVVVLEQDCGQGRRQRQRVERRDHRGDGNGQGELLVELPRQTGDERRRYEHRAQYQRRGDDRAGHFAHGALGGFDRRQAQADIPFDVLHHHDGVVHNDTDGQHQAEQRQGVERETEQVHHGKGTDQGYRHRHQRDDRSAPGLQEQDHHQHNQYQGFEQGMDDRFDGATYEDGRVIDDAVVHAFGEALFELGHFLPDLVGDLDGIGAGALEDRDGHRWLVVEQ